MHPDNQELRLSSVGASMIKRYAGYEIRPTLRPDGVWQIGWGHTGPDVPHSSTASISDEVAQEYFDTDMEKARLAVAALVTVPLTQNQFDALTSFIFSEGVDTFADSHLLTLLNAGDFAETALYWERLGREDGAYLRRHEVARFTAPPA